jgi:hypothetical protein
MTLEDLRNLETLTTEELISYIQIVCTQRDGYKKELEDQNELNVKLGKALDSSQEEVKILKEGYKLLNDYIKKSPCDPDINPEQLEAWSKVLEFKRNQGINL